MSFYTRLIRPIFFRIQPETIHDIVIQGLNIVSRTPGLNGLIRRFCRVTSPRLQTRLGSLALATPVGLSAGFDKYVIAPRAYPMLGFSFAELGSITFQPQPGNPKPRLWRLPADQGLIVHYGLNNDGAAVTARRVGRLRQRRSAYGVSIAVTTTCPPEGMIDDYLASLRTVITVADYITFNVSCPNVASQETFKQAGFVVDLISAVSQELAGQSRRLPVFMKVGADLPITDLNTILDAAMRHEITGIIATNLAKDRSILKDLRSTPAELEHPGGISGRLVRRLSTEMIRHIYRYTNGQLTIIGVGGVLNADDAYAKIRAGASAIQIITGFIYGGPLTVKRINEGLLNHLDRDGFTNLTDAIGADHRSV